MSSFGSSEYYRTHTAELRMYVWEEKYQLLFSHFTFSAKASGSFCTYGIIANDTDSKDDICILTIISIVAQIYIFSSLASTARIL